MIDLNAFVPVLNNVVTFIITLVQNMITQSSNYNNMLDNLEVSLIMEENEPISK